MADNTGTRRAQLRTWVDGTTMLFLALSLVGGTAVWMLRGTGEFVASLSTAIGMIVAIAPIVVGAVLIGAYVQALVPRSAMERWLGRSSGMRGLLIATVAGALTPGGPFAAFPIVLGLYRAGAAFPVCVTYLTAWSLIGVNRALVWELPLLGYDFTLVRILISLPLPILAGLLTRLISPWLAVERP